MGEIGIVNDFLALSLPLGNLLDTAAGVFIEGDVEFLDEVGILVLDEVGVFL